MLSRSKIKAYYYLTKPGIIYGNLLSCVAGFLLAAKGDINPSLFLAVTFGTALTIGSACAFNNYIDRGIDKKMARTKNRAVASGQISGKNALIFATVLGLGGFVLLATFTNLLTLAVGAIGVLFYVVFYGLAKRHSTLGTVVGSIPGATPPVAGYVAVTNNLDLGALLLFLIMVIWQMPHFFAIAIFRLKDYTAAGLPVLPVKKGTKITKVYILLYILAYILAVPTLTFFGYTGYTYFVVMTLLGLVWLWKGVKGFGVDNDNAWARKMFGFSLVVLLAFSFTLSVDLWLP